MKKTIKLIMLMIFLIPLTVKADISYFHPISTHHAPIMSGTVRYSTG